MSGEDRERPGREALILITGGTGVVGRRVVARLAASGTRVVVTSRSEAGARSLRDEIAADARDCVAHCEVDLEEADAVATLLADLQSRDLHPTGLVNGARNRERLGVGDDGMPPRANWIAEYMLNVVVPYELSVKLATAPGSGLRSVVNLSSMYGLVAMNPGLYESPAIDGPVHYGVAKAALIHLTRELGVRLAPLGVNVNAVSFGGVRGRVDQAFEERYARLSPQGRMLQEGDVAGVVEFLLSPAAGAMTGSNVVVDGGWSAW